MTKRLTITIAILIIGFVSLAQSTNPAQHLARRIADKMKDTLALSDSQRNLIYDINLQLHNQKIAIRQQYTGSDSLGIKIQKVENTRDSLYRAVLQEEKFILYRQKKRNLVNNN